MDFLGTHMISLVLFFRKPGVTIVGAAFLAGHPYLAMGDQVGALLELLGP
jgi:hypothetical protein